MATRSTQSTHVIACVAPYGSGGLGRHFSEWADACRRRGEDVEYFTQKADAAVPGGTEISLEGPAKIIRIPPLRFNPGWIQDFQNGWFDRRVAARLQRPSGTAAFTGFGGMSLHCLRRARTLSFSPIYLIAANSHVHNVRRMHRKALDRWRIEKSWLDNRQIRRTLDEYDLADRIVVGSEYTRQSFLNESVPESKLVRFHYHPSPRFIPPTASTPAARDGIFRIVSTGSLTVVKGVPLLIEAFARFRDAPAQLTLVGGSSSRGMRKYLEQAIHRDPRIRIAPGDPLPHLQRADLFVHPSFEDGLSYAPLEAQACGVPVIVTEDTGAKEYFVDQPTARIVPTGDGDALLAAMNEFAAYPTSPAVR